MKNPSKFGSFDYTVQQGCPDVLAKSWFAINHNYKVVAVGETKEEAWAWLETQSLILEDSRGAAVDCYEEHLEGRHGA